MTVKVKYRTIIRCFNSLKIILFELDQLRPNCRKFELKYLENHKRLLYTVSQEYFQLVSLYYLRRTRFLSVGPVSSYREYFCKFFVRIFYDPDGILRRNMVYALPLVEYGMYTKFSTDWSNGADLNKGQTNRQTYIRFYIYSKEKITL